MTQKWMKLANLFIEQDPMYAQTEQRQRWREQLLWPIAAYAVHLSKHTSYPSANHRYATIYFYKYCFPFFYFQFREKK